MSPKRPSSSRALHRRMLGLAMCVTRMMPSNQSSLSVLVVRLPRLPMLVCCNINGLYLQFTSTFHYLH